MNRIKKIVILLLCFLSVLSSPTFAEQKSKLTFKNKTLESIIKENLKFKETHELTKTELSKVKSLDLKFYVIDNLKDIDLLPNLETIKITAYDIKDISALKSMKKLKQIILFNKTYTTYAKAQEDFNKYKKYITIDDPTFSAILEINIAKQHPYPGVPGKISLYDLEQLKSLDFMKMSVDSITNIELCRNLETINLEGTKISNLSSLHKLKKLKNVYFLGSKTLSEAESKLANSKKNITFADSALENALKKQLKISSSQKITLNDLQNIKELNFGCDDKIHDISPLANCINMKYLNIYETSTSDISSLKTLKNLEELVIKHNKIIDYSQLVDFPCLKKLEALISSDNQFDDISKIKTLSTINGIDKDQYKTAMQKAKQILSSIIKPDMSDYEKIVEINDYLLENTSLDYDYTSDKASLANRMTLAGVFTDGLAVFEGYAEAYAYMLSCSAIENKTVSLYKYIPDGENSHYFATTFNMVKTNNNWYYSSVGLSDVDINYESGENTPNKNTFLLSESQLSNLYFWLKTDLPDSKDLKFDYLDTTNGIVALDSNKKNFYYEESGFITRIDLDGNVMRIYKTSANTFMFKDEYLYYINSDDNSTLYRLDPNGLSVGVKLSTQQIAAYYMYNNSIYFTTKDNSGIYSCNLDGSNLKKISSFNAEKLTFYKHYIYFLNTSDDDLLYRIDIDNIANEKISSDKIKTSNFFNIIADDFKIIEDTIYFLNKTDSNKPYKMSLDGTSKVKINDDNCKNLELINGYMYYVNTDTYAHYRIKLSNMTKTKIGVYTR